MLLVDYYNDDFVLAAAADEAKDAVDNYTAVVLDDGSDDDANDDVDDANRLS